MYTNKTSNIIVNEELQTRILRWTQFFISINFSKIITSGKIRINRIYLGRLFKAFSLLHAKQTSITKDDAINNIHKNITRL
jgi:hypothetical protein